MEVTIEQERLDPGVPMMYRDFGVRVRMAYDPHQTTEVEALAVLYARMPRLVEETALHHLSA